MSEDKYLEGVYNNMELAMEILNPKRNMKKLLNTVFKGKTDGILVGKSNNKIKSDAEKIMFDFFKYEKLPDWMID